MSDVEDWIKPLVPAFLENRRRDVEALATADLATARAIGHNLRGVAASYGFPELAAIGARLEAAAAAGDADIVRACRDAMVACLRQGRPANRSTM